MERPRPIQKVRNFLEYRRPTAELRPSETFVGGVDIVTTPSPRVVDKAAAKLEPRITAHNDTDASYYDLRARTRGARTLGLTVAGASAAGVATVLSKGDMLLNAAVGTLLVAPMAGRKIHERLRELRANRKAVNERLAQLARVESHLVEEEELSALTPDLKAEANRRRSRA